MRYGNLTYKEIRKCADEDWLIIIPTGCTEQQGPHLPVDFDTWFIDQVTVTASEKAEQDYGVHSLVLPVIPFGPTPEHRNFGSGYIDLPTGTELPIFRYDAIFSMGLQDFDGDIIIYYEMPGEGSWKITGLRLP